MKNTGTNSIYAKLGITCAVLLLSFQLFTNYLMVDFSPDAGADDKTERAEAKIPCYTVTIDPTVDGFEDKREAVFGDAIMDGTDGFLAELETLLIDEFTRTAWNGQCFEGSFVVSFNVDADGSLGHTIIVHHLRQGGKSVMHGVYNMMYDLDNQGHRWHDGTRGAGEVRIPVRFRIG
ncbi:hypothetical protein [Neolewinella persica]|uniref:hypothetical protein n=1 Tax=Neolewinella persica TaxID=70998 RepID=UPI000380B356|nr:hypothetical protein [Neolewinella persica]